jgi:enamine deaminase RidA (YjgF/YER057c/UK114 family)
MVQRLAFLVVMAIAMTSTPGLAQSQPPPPNGVKTLDPPGAIKAEGTWSLGAEAGDFVFVAGMQGVDPATNILVQDPQSCILRAFLNLKLIAQSEGASLQDCVRLTVYVSDLHRYAPMVVKAQAELWGKPPIPPRTMVEVQRLAKSRAIVATNAAMARAASPNKRIIVSFMLGFECRSADNPAAWPTNERNEVRPASRADRKKTFAA